MRRQNLKTLALVGLCNLALSGCANLRWGGEPLGSISPQDASPSAASASQARVLPATPNAVDTAAADKKDPLEGQFALARLCERRGESEQAEQIYCALLQKAPQDARIHHRLGVLAMKKGDFARAEEQFRAAKTLAPPTAALLSDIGYCCYLQQELPQAEAALKDALNLEPSYATAINNLALVMGREGRFKESLDLFKRNNSEAEAYANLAYVLAQNGQSAQAKEMYLRALTLDNTMRAAAQAMLQIDERQQTQTRLADSAHRDTLLIGPATAGPTAEAISNVDKRAL